MDSRRHLQRLSIILMVSVLMAPLLVPWHGLAQPGSLGSRPDVRLPELVRELAILGDRGTGSGGALAAEDLIKTRLAQAGLSNVVTQSFHTPVRRGTRVRLSVNKNQYELDPFAANSISPDTLPETGIRGPVVYTGEGGISAFNQKDIRGSMVLMDLDSGGNWINALSLGAKAVIYLFEGTPDRFLFSDKLEVSPVSFPRFLLSRARAEQIFPEIFEGAEYNGGTTAVLESDLGWVNTPVHNILALVPGKDAGLQNELVIVEAFYDAGAFVPGRSPGADQSVSVASLLELASYFKDTPPARPVLLAATAGKENSLAGMRQLVWALNLKGKDLKKRAAASADHVRWLKTARAAVQGFAAQRALSPEETALVRTNLTDIAKTRIEHLSGRLMQLRLEDHPDVKQIKALAARRRAYKRLESLADFVSLTPEEEKRLGEMAQESLTILDRRLAHARVRVQELADARRVKKLVGERKIQTVISLHLSSHGKGVGAFNQGWLYEIKKSINAFLPYVRLNDILNAAGNTAARETGRETIFEETLRPSLRRPWTSRLSDRPALGGEVSRLAGFLGISLVSLDDARQFWNTPWDTPERVDMDRAVSQSRFISAMIGSLAGAPSPLSSRMPRNGFAELNARALFMRQGAVFADAPAPGSMVLAFQGPGRFTCMADEEGRFSIKGIATTKLTLHKLILEGYRFDPESGRTVWAVDKKKTTKDRYRLKINQNRMETDLIMFPCSQTSVVNLLEPRTFDYLTRLKVLDARTDAVPVYHWYSRIDTRDSLINSVYVPPGTRIKLGYSDTLLTPKVILTHAGKKNPAGNGYRVDHTPAITPTRYLAARDMWALLNPRIRNLAAKGIRNEKIGGLASRGNQALDLAREAYEARRYDRFFKYSGEALALAGRVYLHADKVQKDVLYGVLFYIMLFAPFAFCLERLVFAFINIYKRILGVTGILLALIAVIYQVHPAFEMAYSPLVIILAFFILGLSGLVTWIIFNRFEREMKQFQLRGRRGDEGEISLLKAFAASFLMGVNNLRRRRMRTFSTCTTLIILTFTIMSFTSVTSIRSHTRLLYDKNVPYHGLLMKQMNWRSLPPAALEMVENAVAGDGVTAAPRGWLETDSRTNAPIIPVTSGKRAAEARGMLGLAPAEDKTGGAAASLVSGRWFEKEDRYAVILPRKMAERLGIKDLSGRPATVNLWSLPFKVVGIFNEDSADGYRDLDGEPLTPVIFPDEMAKEVTEAEMEAMESGEDIRSFQSRYTHIPAGQTLIVPYRTLVSLGGRPKSISLITRDAGAEKKIAADLLDRFGLWLFSGEPAGVFVYNAGDRLNYSGLPNILVPILISMFIVFNTMVGSVQERRREIGIYTSIGMAPSHVSVIFIAEAMAYAVLSVVTGYLFAQVVVKVFAGTSLMAGLTANYSSLGGVFAMALVMAVVLLSSIYPSRVATSIAIPDVEKTWELNRARGDILDVDLPFLIKDSEEKSVCGYLSRMFHEYRAVSHGIFSVGRLSILAEDDGAAKRGLRFTAWLAPFDLGVMQDVAVTVAPAGRFPGYLSVRMAIYRKSGEQNTWWRINKRFVNLIRKQLLIWRSMDIGEKIKAAAFLDELPEKGMDES